MTYFASRIPEKDRENSNTPRVQHLLGLCSFPMRESEGVLPCCLVDGLGPLYHLTLGALLVLRGLKNLALAPGPRLLCEKRMMCLTRDTYHACFGPSANTGTEAVT
jgi:hypothetical protein